MRKEQQIIREIEKHGGLLSANCTKTEAMHQALSVALQQHENREKTNTEARFDQELKTVKVNYTREFEELKFRHNEKVKAANISLESSLEEIHDIFKRTENELKKDFSRERAEIDNDLEKMKEAHLMEWLPWDDSFWEGFVPEGDMIEPPLTRIGHLNVKGKADSIIVPAQPLNTTAKNPHIDALGNQKDTTIEVLRAVVLRQLATLKEMKQSRLTCLEELYAKVKTSPLIVPALLRIITSKNLLINASGDYKDTALEGLRAIMLRLLATIPPGKVKFVLIDPVGLGSNMAGFMHLPEDLVGKKIWTEPNHIERQLTDLSTHMETIIQKYLRDDYVNMEAYNEKAGEVAEPYRFLVVANFPANFSEAAAQRLISIGSNGPRTGVYTLVMRDTQQKLPYEFRMEELERLSTVIDFEKGRFIWRDEAFEAQHLTFDALPPVKHVERILKRIGEDSKLAGHVEVSFDMALKETGDWWHMKSDDGLSVPIGRAGARDLQKFSVGKGTLQHVLIAGKTGSGKSNLLHVIIMSLCTTYSPDELVLYLVDFKKGIEFKTYAATKLPHAKVIAIQSEREFGLSVLQGLDDELQRRGDVFRNASVQNLSDFRKKNGTEIIPRIVLLVDEFQEFFTEDDAIAAQSSLLLDRLVRQGRAFGIHIILASQALAGAYTISRSTTDQMAIRIALQCTDADSRLILGEDNPNARLLSRPGEAFYNDANGLIEGNSLFQVFFLPDEEREKYLIDLNKRRHSEGLARDHRVIIFEGNAPSDINSNEGLRTLASSHQRPEPSDKLVAWLGEPIAIKPHVCGLFRRQSRSNLIIVGQNEKSAVSMLIASLVSLAAQREPGNIEFHILDLTKADTSWNDCVGLLPEILNHNITLYKRLHVEEAIENVHAALKEREALDQEDGAPIFLFMLGLQRAGALRSTDGYTFPESAENLFYILSNGPDYGIHTVCWGDTCKNIERSLSRNISEFDLRVALQMSVNDSNEVIDSPEANKLGQYRALFYDEEKVGNLAKFRPYALPSKDWLKGLAGQLTKK